MSPRPVFDKPSEAFVVEGEVVVVGPENIAHAYTPKAARETGIRLTDAADEAERLRAAQESKDTDDPR